MTKLLYFFENLHRFLTGKKHAITIGLFLLLSFTTAFSQTSLKGKVIDEKSGEPLIGVNIQIKGTVSGALTNAEGSFEVPLKQTLPITLLVSSVGYKYQEIDVYETEALTITLSEDVNKVGSVVVIGYGTQKREEITGSITSIPVSKLKETGASSFINGLQGLASGVQVTQTSGSPGGAATVRIRGGNSINGGNDPLYVIDGFPVYNDNSIANAGALIGAVVGSSTGAGTNINPLSSINPSDIESVDVLKDASATAIYGSRGANGVIIITTKQGKTGASTVTFDESYGLQQVSHQINLLNAEQWGIYKNDARTNAGLTPQFSQSQLDSLGKNNTNWQSASLRTAPISNHQVTFNGGNDKTKYSISLGYLKQQGIVIGSDFQRFTGRVRLDSKLSDRLSVGLNINESYSTSDVVPSGIIANILELPPSVPIKTNGVYTFKSPYESAIANPIASLNLETNQSAINRILASAFAEYKIIEGLKAKILLGSDLLDNKQNSYIPSTLFEANAQGGIASVGAIFTKNILNENTLTYDKSFDNIHHLQLLAGFTQQESSTEGVIAGSSGFANNIVTYNNLAAGATKATPQSSYSNWALQSYLGRLNYNYLEKYFFTASFRADGSSRLGANNRWGYFPSLSVAWQINKESFLEGIKDQIKLSNLKLRVSAGVTGNQQIPPYQSLSLLSGYPYPTGTGTTITGYAPSQAANPDLKWETTAQYDAGLDFGFIDQRIKFVFDAYYKKTSDLLLNVPQPLTSGFTGKFENVGSVENKGLEFDLNSDNIRGEFSWNSDISLSINRNKVLSLGGPSIYLVPSEIQTGSAIVVGQPLGTFWGYKTNGLYIDASQIPATPLLANTKVGDVQYVDVNKDGKITQAGDQTEIGSAQPKFIFGFSNTFTYSDFDLSFFIQGSQGNQIYSYLLQQLQVPTGYQNLIAAEANHYTATNTNTNIQRANQTITTNPVSDLYVYDGSYIRLKSITLGYNLPKSISSKFKVNKFRVYVTGQNLFTKTKYPGFDPEVNYYDANSSRQGVDVGGYPVAKTFIGGLSLTF